MPIAFVVLIHFCGDRVKAFNRASFLNPSNSRGLKSGLYKQLFATENSIGLFRRDDELGCPSSCRPFPVISRNSFRVLFIGGLILFCFRAVCTPRGNLPFYPSLCLFPRFVSGVAPILYTDSIPCLPSRRHSRRRDFPMRRYSVIPVVKYRFANRPAD